jgi:hypothetical protein
MQLSSTELSGSEQLSTMKCYSVGPQMAREHQCRRLDMLTLLVLSIGFTYIIATATRAIKSPDNAGGFACGCLFVLFAAGALADVIWAFRHPGSPVPGGSLNPPEYQALVWWLLFIGLIILASIINYTIYRERRHAAARYAPPPPQYLTGATPVRKLLERVAAHPIVFVITLVASVLGIIGFYLQFLRSKPGG